MSEDMDIDFNLDLDTDDFYHLFHKEPDKWFQKIVTKLVYKGDDGKYLMFMLNGKKENNEYYYQKTENMFRISDPDVDYDYSHGLNYHHYILQNLIFYEDKNLDPITNSRYDYHSHCLHKRLGIHIINRMNKEFVDYRIHKERNQLKSIYKTVGQNFNNKFLTSYTYKSCGKGLNVEPVVINVFNGQDYSNVIMGLTRFAKRSRKHVANVIKNKMSIYSYFAQLQHCEYWFDVNMNLLLLNVIHGPFKKPLDMLCKTLYKISRKISEDISDNYADFQPKFERFLHDSDMNETEKQALRYEYEKQVNFCFIFTVPLLMSIVCAFYGVVSLDSVRHLIRLLKQFSLTKYLEDIAEFSPSRF